MKGIQTWARLAWLGLGLLGFLAGGWGPWARYPYSGTLVEEQRAPGTGASVMGLVWTGFTNLEFHAQKTRSAGNRVAHRVVVSSLTPDWVLVSNELSGIQKRPVQVTEDVSTRGRLIRWRLSLVGAALGMVLGAMLRWPKQDGGANGVWVVWIGVFCVAVFAASAKWIRGQPAAEEAALQQALDQFRGGPVSNPAVSQSTRNPSAVEKPERVVSPAPASPGRLQLKRGGKGGLELSWDSPATRHEIVRSPRPEDGAIETNAIVVWKGSPYSETNLPPGRWFYAVRAVGESGKSPWVWSGEGWAMPGVAELKAEIQEGGGLWLNWKHPNAMPEDTTIRVEAKARGGEWAGVMNLPRTADKIEVVRTMPSEGAIERWRVGLVSSQWGTGAWVEVAIPPSVRGRGEVAGGVISLAGVKIEGATQLELLVRERAGGNARVARTDIAVTNVLVRLPEVHMTNRQYRLEANHPNGRMVVADWSGRNISPERPYTNSLGQRFVPVPGTEVLFCIWETRVRDFAAFVQAKRYDAETKMWSWNPEDKTKVGVEQWIQRGDTWRKPGWDQTGEHPVVGVSYEDAVAYCRWLTDVERAEGRIGAREAYRLPTDAEWDLAVGGTKYPWGNDLPPPAKAGNYAGEEFDEGWGRITGYRDKYRRTSPVGEFNANAYGLYDLGGNVWEFVDDWYRKEMNSAKAIEKYSGLAEDGGGKTYRVLRGASWYDGDPVFLESSFRLNERPQYRYGSFGFRCVLGAEVAR